MKKLIFILISIVAGNECRAQWAVVDVANLTQNILNYVQILQQVSNQAQQIQQSEDMLNRLGSMANVTAVVGFPALQVDLTLPTQLQTWSCLLYTSTARSTVICKNSWRRRPPERTPMKCGTSQPSLSRGVPTGATANSSTESQTWILQAGLPISNWATSRNRRRS